MLLYRLSAALLACGLSYAAHAQRVAKDSIPLDPPKALPSAAKWYDKISLRGYSQFRYNRLLETNPDLRCEQCDRSIGQGQGLSFRRGRLIFSGDVHPRVFIYLQFDYSADASSTNKHFLQVRDAYADIALDRKKEFRLRAGQSKVPFGFENLQSSSNRLPLDRADALNSAAPNERDMGAFFYFAPAKVRKLFKHLVDDNLKGSGDYGVFALGLHNGQATNKPEQNDNLHAVARLNYPFRLGKQIVEPGLQAYVGKFTLAKDQLSAGTKTLADLTYDDRRVAASLVVYPQPIGIQAEYNWGKSPTFDSRSDSITSQNLRGGYITACYKTQIGKSSLMPFVRYQTYQGGKKHELDARRHEVKEVEIGAEWQIYKNLELTLAYAISHRSYADFKTKNYDERGNFLRVQVQLNY